MDEEFEALVDEAIDTIPTEFRDKMENVSVFVEDFPNSLQIKKLRGKGFRGLLLGLYEGVPHTRRGRYGIGAFFLIRLRFLKGLFWQLQRTPSV